MIDQGEGMQFGRPGDGNSMFQRELLRLRRRLVSEATVAIRMLESSLASLWAGDVEGAADVRRQEERVDLEEVAIEQECLRLMALRQPFAHDFRALTFCLKVNEDVERVADHAASIAKITRRLVDTGSVAWPTALRDMGDRVPAMCHELLRAVLDEDVEAARLLIQGDKVIDELDRRLFEEVREWIERDPSSVEHALLAYRMGRELERVGDLMANIAEDVVYLATGVIVRHAKRRAEAS